MSTIATQTGETLQEAVSMYGSGLNEPDLSEVDPENLDRLDDVMSWSEGWARGIPVVIEDRKRLFNKASSYRPQEEGSLVLNTVPEDGAVTTGLWLVPHNAEEYESLVVRESGYDDQDATVAPYLVNTDDTALNNQFQDAIDSVDRTFVFGTSETTTEGKINPRYAAIVIEGARSIRERVANTQAWAPESLEPIDLSAYPELTGDFLEDTLRTTYTADGVPLTDWLDDPDNAERVVEYVNGFDSVDDWLAYDSPASVRIDRDPYTDLRKWRAAATSEPPVNDEDLAEEAKWMDQYHVPDDVQPLVEELANEARETRYPQPPLGTVSP